MFDVDVPKLFGKDARKVVLHMDSATSHTARKTVACLNSRGIKFITKDQWLPNSPELAPMDYFANGDLKKNDEETSLSIWAWHDRRSKGGVVKHPARNVSKRPSGMAETSSNGS